MVAIFEVMSMFCVHIKRFKKFNQEFSKSLQKNEVLLRNPVQCITL